MKKLYALYLVSVAIVAVAGLSVFARGVYLASKPCGWMTAGLFLFTPAFFVLYGKGRK